MHEWMNRSMKAWANEHMKEWMNAFVISNIIASKSMSDELIILKMSITIDNIFLKSFLIKSIIWEANLHVLGLH